MERDLIRSIIKELELSEKNIKMNKQYLDELVCVRDKICKFVKMDQFNYLILEGYQANILCVIEKKRYEIDVNNTEIIQLKKDIDEIKTNVIELKISINYIDEKIEEKRIESRRLHKILRMFLSNNKIDKYKRKFIPKYIIQLKKYGNINGVNEKINNCNLKKENLRKERTKLLNRKSNLENKADKKKKLSGKLKKNSLHKQKEIESLLLKLKMLEKYMEEEKNIVFKITNT